MSGAPSGRSFMPGRAEALSPRVEWCHPDRRGTNRALQGLPASDETQRLSTVPGDHWLLLCQGHRAVEHLGGRIHHRVEDRSDEVALKATQCLALGLALGETAGDVVLRRLVAAQLG